ncbi:MAG TPA: transketolase C-terminal domain-containing protein, partial [Fimbriimonadaceae bacterium]|nr:transketolase C-terminal domain-containing protein [Fimbriimonadaceae bacterium]
TICGLARTADAMVTIEENVQRGGYGEAVRAALADGGFSHLRHELMALPDSFVEHGAQPLIRSQCGLDAESIVAAVRRALAGAKTPNLG